MTLKVLPLKINKVKNQVSGNVIDFKVGDFIHQEGSSRTNPRLIKRLFNKDSNLYYEAYFCGIDDINVGCINKNTRHADSLQIFSHCYKYPELDTKRIELQNMGIDKELPEYKLKQDWFGFKKGHVFNCFKKENLGDFKFGDQKVENIYCPKDHWSPMIALLQIKKNNDIFELIPQLTEEQRAKKKLEAIDDLTNSFNDLL